MFPIITNRKCTTPEHPAHVTMSNVRAVSLSSPSPVHFSLHGRPRFEASIWASWNTCSHRKQASTRKPVKPRPAAHVRLFFEPRTPSPYHYGQALPAQLSPLLRNSQKTAISQRETSSRGSDDHAEGDAVATPTSSDAAGAQMDGVYRYTPRAINRGGSDSRLMQKVDNGSDRDSSE